VAVGLPTVRLGWTDVFLTRVGFGSWAAGGDGWAYAWSDQDDAETKEDDLADIAAAIRTTGAGAGAGPASPPFS
jgi:aryl-alcohol dehydrogenase-like predicted oxidoreductase